MAAQKLKKRGGIDGKPILVTLTGTVAAGDPYYDGTTKIFGVYRDAGVSGDQVNVDTEGEFEAQKSATTLVLSAGNPIWIVSGTGIATKASANALAGVISKDSPSGTAGVFVRINETDRDL